MADKGRVHSAISIKLLFEGEDHQRLVDVVAQKPHPPLSPCPELRRHVIDRRNSAPLHLPGDAPVEGGRVNHDREIELALVGFFDQVSIQAEDLWQVAEDLSNADDRQVFGIDHGVASGSPHALATHAKEFKATIQVDWTFGCPQMRE